MPPCSRYARMGSPIHPAMQEAEANGRYPAPRADVKWHELGFGLTTKDTKVAIATCPEGGEWSAVRVEPYGPLSIEPAATVLNYGQGVFEGMKAFRTTTGRIVLFRPQMNAQRLARGAERFLMPPVPQELFLSAVAAAVRANSEWVPPAGEGTFYLRPMLIGSGPTLGVRPSTEFTLIVYGAPVGKYFKGGGARMLVEAHHQRAAPKGVGDVKAAGNYAPCFSAQRKAAARGYSDVIYLDVSGRCIEEAAASNFFCLGHDGILRTPSLGTILPGVTRDSVIQLAKRLAGEGVIRGVREGEVSLEDVAGAKEAFVTGTGAGIAPVAHVTLPSGTAVDMDVPGPATKLIQDALRDIQMELAPDEFGWLWDPFEAPGAFSAEA
mmetsp:Transcript_52280/g.163921  ORF Transcript_52280/g.163921 Transcript_52280/m.163921 type:complete len:380 (-) Transcript_52280:51-1190(-)